MRRLWSVYRHISPSGKVYIGISNDVKSRWSGNGFHYLAKRDGKFMQPIFARAILKYGWDNMTHEVLLEGLSKSHADYAERYLIKWYKLKKISYNITDGGEGATGRIVSQETKEKMRQMFLGVTPWAAIEATKKSEKSREASKRNILIAHAAWKGSHHTEDVKKRMSEAAKGRDMSKAAAASAKKHRKKVIIVSPQNEQTICNSYKEAADILGSNSSNILRALQTGIKVKHYKILKYV